MKLGTLALTVVLVPACRTQSEKEPEPVREPLATGQPASDLDFSAYQDRSMTVEEFVKTCQQVSGFNFTYTESTQTAMNAASLRLDGPDRVPAPEFGTFLSTQLARCGFTCEPVGPEHLHVLLIQPRPM